MQNVCDFDRWLVSDYIEKIDQNRVYLPKFQRGITWGDERKKNLIASIRQGFPIGSILLAKTESVTGVPERYQIIDGLQRTTAIRQYLKTPTQFVGVSDLLEDWKDTAKWMALNLHNGTNEDSQIDEPKIEEFLLEFITNSNIEDLQSIKLLQLFKEKFNGPSIDEMALNDSLRRKIEDFFKSLRNNLNINNVTIPIILFSGDRSLLPEIFERLNSQGLALSKYQIYAATWDKVCSVSNPEIISAISQFYSKRLEDSSLEIENIDEDGTPEELTLFDYLTGLGTVLTNRFPTLFEENWSDKIAFKIANMAHKLNPSQMPNLPFSFIEDNSGKIKTEDFTAAVIKICDEVNEALKGRLSLKLNSSQTAEFSGHTEFQIATIITRLLVEDFQSPTWLPITHQTNTLKRLQMIRRWYLIDRIRNIWGNAGDSQSFRQVWTSNELNEYVPNTETLVKSSVEELDRAFESWFQDEMMRKDRTRTSVNRETKLVLRYFYYSRLSVQDEDERTFHLDHLVPVSWWKKFLRNFENAGAPINSIGNLCLMIDSDNADKKKKLPFRWFELRSANEDVIGFRERCLNNYFLIDDPNALNYPEIAEPLDDIEEDALHLLEAVQNGLKKTSEERWKIIKTEILTKLAD